jgi:sulfhydrogenase subunit gamma (sulfur reductase)
MSTVIANPLMPRRVIVEQNVPETHDTFSLRVSLNEQDEFLYKPGQFNMLSIPGVGEAPFSFSLLNSRQKEFVHTIRQAGNVVDALKRLTSGDCLDVRGPFGNGWPLEKARGRNVIIMAGGIGMAPLRPVVHYILNHKKNFRKVYLLYGAKIPSDLLYQDELQSWAQDISVLLSADRMDGPGLLNLKEGLVTTLFEDVDVHLQETVSFICGPPIMMKFASTSLLLDGQEPDDIYLSLERRMKCGIGHCGHCQAGPKYICKDGPVFSLSEIRKVTAPML